MPQTDPLAPPATTARPLFRQDPPKPRTPAAPVRPPTLGDELEGAMRTRAHTSAEAALELGATRDELRAWCGDLEAPDRRYHAALVGYLRIDEGQPRGLILRGQMRRTQARIRG